MASSPLPFIILGAGALFLLKKGSSTSGTSGGTDGNGIPGTSNGSSSSGGGGYQGAPSDWYGATVTIDRYSAGGQGDHTHHVEGMSGSFATLPFEDFPKESSQYPITLTSGVPIVLSGQTDWKEHTHNYVITWDLLNQLKAGKEVSFESDGGVYFVNGVEKKFSHKHEVHIKLVKRQSGTADLTRLG